MKTLNEIQTYLAEKTAENKKEVAATKENIRKTEQTIQKANEELIVAETEVDVERYNKAKDTIWAANHAKELYQKQRDKLKQEPLISKSEYNELLAEITQAANKVHEEQNERAVALISELRKISEESSQTSQQANELIHTLQRKVYKEPEGTIPLENGGTTWSSDKTYENSEAVHIFYQSKIAGTSLSKMAGEEPQSTRNYWFK
ncbi:hypothetical protein [Enterococcus faecium]|uniref:hypothetical protein n=1 Tax=Enterococcus faecium TaxID=1352 RepID=UPI000A98E0BC|nr:hypothetical protein [Enterococcus faecium]MBK4830798.1 hypothetical protein [Enterococcus faecium]MBK4859959.1 hypothetical protein [Enterococcus faecium]BDP45663.1 hypothetical protein EfmJHP9_05330 [Enterococcus faecium]BDP49108.1 hypothetical protein EfmJHP10_05440 [Enterococcus faecium]